jgi:hypothetical protein
MPRPMSTGALSKSSTLARLVFSFRALTMRVYQIQDPEKYKTKTLQRTSSCAFVDGWLTFEARRRTFVSQHLRASGNSRPRRHF